MKKIFNSISLLATTLLATITSCTENMEYKDVNVVPVGQIYEPTDNKAVELVASATASLFFEWEASKAEDSGSPLYEVVFDKEGGDFSTPLYKVLSDNNGAHNYATISHKTLNKIGAAAGLNGGETGTVIWTVVASRGLNSVMSSVSQRLTITRLLGFAEIPTQLYLTGTATEGGVDATKAVPCSSPEQGSFEIFTRLEGGKTYKLADKNGNDAKWFHIDGTKILEGDGETPVDHTGIYRIRMDFSVAAATISEISSLGLFFCPSNAVIWDLPYEGNGVFANQGTIEFKQEGWGRDERYKFLMKYADGSQQFWGTKNGTDSAPGEISMDDPYFYITETGDNQWDDKWKFNHEFDGAADGFNPGAVTRISVLFNGANYTHHVELVK